MGFQKIKESDFYQKEKIFSIWLIKKKKEKFEDLSTKKQQKYFKKFCKKYNKQKLKEIYYNEEQLIKKYGHLLQSNQWNIQNQQITEEEIFGKLLSEKDLFDRDLEENSIIKASTRSQLLKQIEQEKNKPLQDKIYEREIQKENEKYQNKIDRKMHKKEQNYLLEELVPKKVGKEAILEKKRILNQKINGAKDESGVDELGDDFLYGGGSDLSQLNFQREQNKLLQRMERKMERQRIAEEEIKQKRAELELKEKKAMELILKGGKQFN